MDVKACIAKQRAYFTSGVTRSYAFRIAQLKKIKKILHVHEADIIAALANDLHKPTTDALLSEILILQQELDLIMRGLKNWMRVRKVPTPLSLWPGKSRIHYEPYGLVLILSPWNYPFYLTFSPLIGAIAAGNCVVLKPSEISTHTEKLIASIMTNNFSDEFLAVVTGGPSVAEALLQEKWDYIFYTGNSVTAKTIMHAAAMHLTPLTLELGGKSPCIVDESADLDFAARRIAWAKGANAGQVCIAPDYLLVHANCKAPLITKLQRAFTDFYGTSPKANDQYARIINAKHFSRLQKLMEGAKIIFGGETDPEHLYIAPTLIDEITWSQPIMQEEIFGPLLPILTFDEMSHVITKLQTLPKPLALYLFSKNNQHIEAILNQVSFGGGCINDCFLHIANPNLPFGGVGLSGMGQYHGKFSFTTFSHRKSVMHKRWLIDFKVEYPPFTPRKEWWLRRLFKL